ncbi:protein grindelwald [Toxorhynchites rutilus septentrionalis]|uniref:protein grindelwald n=1 Tax=Toxorhynchites rutilus septentrionalis TaxID=329112 RepID=UPI00247AB35A|nr:protein grindelwald [Toxorhynchites rutilus septentrionalis]
MASNANGVRSIAAVVIVLMTVAVISVSSEPESCHDSKPCPEDEYCDMHNFSCSHCSEICTLRETRYDCSKKCKDYLILQRIAILEDNLYTTIITFAVILLMLAIIVVAIIARWCRKNGHLSCAFLKRLIGASEKSHPPAMEYTHENPHTKSPKLQARNTNNNIALPPLPAVATVRPASTYMGSDEGASVRTVTTPISQRYPLEDWRENHAYDNGGLAITPTENTYEYVEAKMNQQRF